MGIGANTTIFIVISYCALLILVLIACCVAARRASQVDPIIACALNNREKFATKSSCRVANICSAAGRIPIVA